MTSVFFLAGVFLRGFKMRYFKSISLAMMVALCTAGTSHAGALGASPNLGLVFNATVSFFAADGTTLLGTGDTGPVGVVSAEVGSYNGPVLVIVQGDDDATYYDEAAGTTLPFPAGSTLRAIVARPGSTIAVTPLTDIAVGQAQAEGFFPITQQCVNALNGIVRLSLAPGLRSLLTVPTPFDENTTAGSLTTEQSGRYALVLAGLARLGAGASAPALEVLGFLRRDAVDGKINGRVGRVRISPALYGNFIRQLRSAINDVAAEFGNKGLRRIANLQGPVSTNVDGMRVKNLCRRGEPPPPPPPTGGTGGTGSGGGGF